ncbi:MAG: DUF4382 domain-containing protein [bacterium]|nr:DUF4382 domain-containing protein [bacterium]
MSMQRIPGRAPLLASVSLLVGCASLPSTSDGRVAEAIRSLPGLTIPAAPGTSQGKQTDASPRRPEQPTAPAQEDVSRSSPARQPALLPADATSQPLEPGATLPVQSPPADSRPSPLIDSRPSPLIDSRPVWLLAPELIDRRTTPLLDFGLANLLDPAGLVSQQASSYRIASSDRSQGSGNGKDDDDDDDDDDDEKKPENPGQPESTGQPSDTDPIAVYTSIRLHLDRVEVLRTGDLDEREREDRSDEDRETDDREPDEAPDSNPRADGKEPAPRGWIPLRLATGSLDLLHLDRGELPLGETALPTGRYAALRFSGTGSYAGTTKLGADRSAPFSLPGGQLKVPVEFMLREGKSTNLRLRFDARKALLVTPVETRLRPGALRARVRSRSSD